MKTFAVYGAHDEKIRAVFEERGYHYDDRAPDFVVSYGGDGTLLRSEAVYPSVPKLFLKNTLIGKLAQKKENDEVVEAFVAGKFSIKEVNKIEAHVNGTQLVGAMEVSVHNRDPRSALRFKVKLDDEEMHHALIGDGVIVCNVLGSTAYYRSVTDSYFEIGIGLAFNNSTEQADHIVLKNDRIITIEITRGPGAVFADNQDGTIDINDGDIVKIYESKELMRLIRVHEHIFE
jgi:NAD+ kinase